MRAPLLFLVVAALLFSCGPQVGVDADGGDLGGGVGTANTGGGTGTGATVTFCEVQPVLQAKCGSCHGASPVSGAPIILTNADLHAASALGGTLLDRSIIRLSTTPVSGAMPPNLGGNASDIQLFTDFRANGLPDCGGTGGGAGGGGAGGGGTGSGAGGGTGGGGGGVVQTTCASNLTWAYGNNLGARMNPGEACQACHQSRRRGPLSGFMGTVYPSEHEAPLCMVASVPSGVSVEILDTTGAVRRTFAISALSDGNFYGGSVGTPSPYTARVVVNGVVRSQMVTPQTSGDCNVCHTAQGTQGAPGRIHW